MTAAGGGTVTFDCGGPHTITLTAALQVSSAKDQTVIVDGNDVITISGGGKTRIFDLDNYTNFVVQRLTLRDGFVAAGEPEVTNRPSNSGAAIRHPWFGTLKAIDVRFVDNQCASRDGEIGGGAIYAGGLTQAVLSGCEFVNNSASNGGGILNRGSTLTIVDCRFSGNAALGVGDGQYGNGGGVYIDGMNYENPGGDFLMCGTVFEGNIGMTHGSGMFSYYYEGSESVIRDCVFDGNRFDNGGKGSGALYHEAAPLTLDRHDLLEQHRRRARRRHLPRPEVGGLHHQLHLRGQPRVGQRRRAVQRRGHRPLRPTAPSAATTPTTARPSSRAESPP